MGIGLKTRTSSFISSEGITYIQTGEIILEYMLIGHRNLRKKFETYILNRSRENHVFPTSFRQTDGGTFERT